MERQKKSNYVSVILTILILIIIVIFSNNSDGNVSFFENFANKIIVPFQNMMVNIEQKIAKNDVYFTKVDEMEQKISELQEENAKLVQANKELENLKIENEELKEYMNLTQKYGEYKTVPAYVINKSISNYSKVFVVNAGANDGIEKNMAVISDEGLVGHIIEVSDNSSKVLPIIDPSASVSSLMSTTKDSFVCKGQIDSNSELKATYIPMNTTLFKGDSVETSGIGGIYPKGIHIGTIKKIVNTQNIVDKYMIIETAVDFDKLTSVLIVKNN